MFYDSITSYLEHGLLRLKDYTEREEISAIVNPCQSVIQTMYDIAQGGVPIPTAIGTIGIKVETKEGEGTEFIIHLPNQSTR